MTYSKIILCGRRNTGKSTLFWNLQKRLNWPTFSVSQFLNDYVRTNGLQGTTPEVLVQHDTLMLSEIDNRVSLLLNSDHTVLVEARLFHHIKQDWPGTLKVLLVADEPVRIKRNAFRERISVEKSQQRLVKKEDKWIAKMASMYGFGDFFEPRYYDLAIDTTFLSKEQVVEQVLLGLQNNS